MLKNMKLIPTLLTLLILLIAAVASAATREELIKSVPKDSFVIISADFSQLKGNEVFATMDRRGEVWSYEDDSEVPKYLKLLKLDPQQDVKAFAFSRYVNAYGSSGRLHILDLNRAPVLSDKSSTPYLGMSLAQLSAEEEMYAVLLNPTQVALGNFKEVKMAVDIAKGKVGSMLQNPKISSLYRKLPVQAAVWGISLPLSRRQAANVKAKQSTNAMLSAFENYYFYCTPTASNVNTHFFGETADDKQAQFATAFMTGTLLMAKFRAQPPLTDILDRVDIKNTGKTVHISAVITKELVDAYFEGKLGL